VWSLGASILTPHILKFCLRYWVKLTRPIDRHQASRGLLVALVTGEGGLLSQYCHNVSCGETKIMWLVYWLVADGENFLMIICLRQRRRYMFLPVFVCLSVSKITQKRVDGFGWNVACRQTDVGTWTNWFVEPDPDHTPDAGTGLLSPISYKRCYAEFYVGKIPLAPRR